MLKTIRALEWLQRSPNIAIQAILASVLIITGIYLSGPWYNGGATTAVGLIFDSQIARSIVGLTYTLAGAASMYGIFKGIHKFRYFGSFAVFLSYSFMVILRLFAFGLIPIFWLIMLGLTLISGVMYLIEARDTEEVK